MGIKQKFIILSGIVGVILAAVSVIGYFTAYSNLEEVLMQRLQRQSVLKGNQWMAGCGRKPSRYLRRLTL
jgi:hypothetical protein